MFRGNHPTRVDDKGRLKIPAEYKRQIEEQYGNQFFITSRDGKVALIYPMKEWEKIEEQLAQISNLNESKQRFLDVVNYYGQTVEFDAQGRVLLPQILREKAGLTGDVAVFGKQTYLEVTNQAAFLEKLEANPVSQNDLVELERLGLK